MTPTFLPRSREDGMREGKRVLKAATSAAMLKLMRLNVLKGTAKRADVEGYRVGGKTGTAEKVVGGRYSTSALLTSFLAAFLTDAPEYLVLVMLDEPQRVAESGNQATAGVNAAPTAARSSRGLRRSSACRRNSSPSRASLTPRCWPLLTGAHPRAGQAKSLILKEMPLFGAHVRQ